MKILVIQQKMIGDVLISSLLCDNLRLAYPDATIDYMVYESTISVLQGNKSISNLVLLKEKHRKSKLEFLYLLLEIRRKKYDIVIDSYSKLESFLPVIFSGANKKISFYKKWQNLLYTNTVKRIEIPETNLGLIIEQRLSLLKPLNLNIKLQTFPKIFVSEEEIQFSEYIFKNYKIDDTKKNVMVSIIGSSTLKTYPPKYIAEIIDVIAEKYDVNILFNYMPNQIELATKIFNFCNIETQKKIFFDVLGKDLREFIAIMNKCDIIIGNDGGAINIAKAIHKPSFIIFSPWIDKKGWATFEDGINHVSVHLNDFRPELFENRNYENLKKNATELYDKFTPEIFQEKLKMFLIRHLS